MLIVKYAEDLKHQLMKYSAAKASIGFVPTMGALHNGHISLLQRCKEECNLVICSIFVNPTQFTNADDFNKYPITINEDIKLLEKNNCDILFVPDVEEIYPEGTGFTEHFNLGYLETVLEGKYRPGHFQGVCQVVKRLLQIVNPTHLFIGQKDYQQCMVLKRLLQIMNSNAKLIICPTLREENGLAMSSRNLRLSSEQKNQASEIYKMLCCIKENQNNISLQHVKKQAEESLTKKNFKVDYVEICNADDLKIVENAKDKTKRIALIAAFLNDVRLIDNMLLTD